MLVLLAACAEPPTQVAVRLVTDLRVPMELDSVGLTIIDDDGRAAREGEVRELPTGAEGELFHEIASFGVRPLGGDAQHRFEVRAEARRGSVLLFETSARTGFVEGRTIRLDLYLPALCIDVAATCRPDETCGLAGCVDPTVEPSGLPVGSTSAPVEPDGDARRPASPVDEGAPRLIRPASGARLLGFETDFEFELPAGTTRARIEVCTEPTCAEPSLVVPEVTSPWPVSLRDLPVRFYRVVAEVGGEDRASAPWPLVTRHGAPPDDGVPDSSCGRRLDFDRDGAEDFVVGAPDAGAGRGAVFVYLGDPRRPLSELAPIRVDGPATASGFGRALDLAGDVDGDGFGDLIVGAPGPAAAPGGGRAFILRGGPDGRATLTELPFDVTHYQTGVAVAGVGDVDRDGYADVAVGAIVEGGAPPSVVVYPGGPAGARTGEPWPVAGITGDGTLVTIAGGGDHDQDRFDDFLVGTPLGDRVFLVRGGPDGPLGAAPLEPVGFPTTGTRYGQSIAVGVVSGGSTCDVVVAAPVVDASEGALVLFTGGASPTTFVVTSVTGLGAAPALAIEDVGVRAHDTILAAGGGAAGYEIAVLPGGAEPGALDYLTLPGPGAPATAVAIPGRLDAVPGVDALVGRADGPVALLHVPEGVTALGDTGTRVATPMAAEGFGATAR